MKVPNPGKSKKKNAPYIFVVRCVPCKMRCVHVTVQTHTHTHACTLLLTCLSVFLLFFCVCVRQNCKVDLVVPVFHSHTFLRINDVSVRLSSLSLSLFFFFFTMIIFVILPFLDSSTFLLPLDFPSSAASPHTYIHTVSPKSTHTEHTLQTFISIVVVIVIIACMHNLLFYS